MLTYTLPHAELKQLGLEKNTLRHQITKKHQANSWYMRLLCLSV
jgi:hypothetical protein